MINSFKRKNVPLGTPLSAYGVAPVPDNLGMTANLPEETQYVEGWSIDGRRIKFPLTKELIENVRREMALLRFRER